MYGLALLVLLPGQIETVRSAAFSRKLQTAAVLATVRIVNPARKAEGSGVVLGKKGKVLFILTAGHLVDGAEGLEVAVFSAASYPRPARVYKTAEVVARSKGIEDLALLRLTTADQAPSSLPVCPARVVPGAGEFSALGVGCSGGEAPTGRVVKVLGKRRVRREVKGRTADFWEVAGRAAEGRSGGPLVNRHGYLLGILSGTSGARSYFCHTREIHAFLKSNGLE